MQWIYLESLFFLIRSLLHNSPTITKNCLTTKPHTPKQTCMRWCKIVSQRCLWEELILLFICFHEHFSPFLKAFSLCQWPAVSHLAVLKKKLGDCCCAFVINSNVPPMFQWWRGYFLQQHMLADAFACVNKKRSEQKLIRLGSKQGSIILCWFPGFAESFLALRGCHSGRAAEHSSLGITTETFFFHPATKGDKFFKSHK